MPNYRSDYASFLLRFQCIQTNGQCIWVASMQSTATGESRSFTNVDSLVQFLLTEFGEGEAASELRKLKKHEPRKDN